MSEPTRNSQPIILIRGFGQFDVSDEKHGDVLEEYRSILPQVESMFALYYQQQKHLPILLQEHLIHPLN